MIGLQYLVSDPSPRLKLAQMGVDTHRSSLLRINLDMSFPSLPCQGKQL